MHAALSRPESSRYLQLRTKSQNISSTAVTVRYMRADLLSILWCRETPHTDTSPMYIPARSTDRKVLLTPVTISYFDARRHATEQAMRNMMIAVMRISHLLISTKIHTPPIKSAKETAVAVCYIILRNMTQRQDHSVYPQSI